jgi:hypothetical protein
MEKFGSMINILDPQHCTSALKTGSGSAHERAADPQYCTRTITLIFSVCSADYVSPPGEGPEVGRGVEKKEEVTGLLAYLVTDATGRQFLVPSGLLPTEPSPT